MAASSNASVRSALGVAGAVLAVAAQACLARPERWRSWLPTTPDGSLNAILRWMSPLDAAVGAAVLALLLATGLMAYALRPFMTLGLPAGTGVPANTIPPTRDGRFGLLLGVTIAALLAFFLVPALRPAAAWIWLAALAWPAIFLRRFDLRVGPRGLRPLFSRGEVLLLASVAGGVLILVGHDLTAVSWAGLGDEIRFFTTAKEILQGQFSRDPLSEDGLWGYHPVLSHLWQAMFMRVLGPTQFAWRLSSLVAFIIALPPFYFFVREWWNRRVATVALIWLASAPAAVTFAHFGFNNIQALSILCCALGVFAWAQRASSRFGYYLSGIIAGLGCYTYFTARLAMPVLLILAVCTVRATEASRARACLSALLLGMCIAALPALVNAPATIEHMLRQTVFADPAAMTSAATSDPSASIAAQLVRHSYLTLIHPAAYHSTQYNVVPPIFNPLESTLTFVGMFGLILVARRDARSRGIVVAAVLCGFVTGAISQFGMPTITRLMFLSPFVALCAAIATDQIVTAGARSLVVLREHTAAICLAIALLGGAWSAWQVVSASAERPRGAALGTTSELVRLAQLQPPGSAILFVEGNDSYMDAVDLWLEAYGLADKAVFLGGRERRRRGAESVNLANIPTAVRNLEAPCLVAYDLRDKTQIETLRRQVAERFPKSAIRWIESEPGKSWSVMYAVIKQDDE
ncbi:hypothetical protein AYO41_03710 [Verrucomicrobia bacterium SCGC AG-212-E04]|nr:hypothetical protein AYO41_03710 [Verrucomicrobia bacterium SCGC AG-212-E04]